MASAGDSGGDDDDVDDDDDEVGGSVCDVGDARVETDESLGVAEEEARGPLIIDKVGDVAVVNMLVVVAPVVLLSDLTGAARLLLSTDASLPRSGTKTPRLVDSVGRSRLRSLSCSCSRPRSSDWPV